MTFPQIFFSSFPQTSSRTSEVEDLHLAVLAAEAFGATGHPAGTAVLRVRL